MGNYERVTDQNIEELEKIAGRKNVSTKETEKRDYSKDEAPQIEPKKPEVIIKPENTEQVSKTLSYANEKKIPVTPRGGGTGLSGGAIPLHGGILLSLENMDKILEIDGDNFMAVVEPGAEIRDFYEAVERKGFYYPVYPGEDTATIGGTVATNAGGMKAVKYGVTRDNVAGIEAVLPSGEVIRAGGKYIKSSTGYDLRHLITGSEGTLAVVTKIILKLRILPKERRLLIAPFDRMEDAVQTAPDLLREGLPLTGIEFMSDTSLEVCQNHSGINIPVPEGEAYLLILIDAHRKEGLKELVDSATDICMGNGAKDVLVPGTKKEMEKILQAREDLYYAIQELGPLDLADVVVPRSKIMTFMEKIEEISDESEVLVAGSGHAGDGNVHIATIGVDMSEEKFKESYPKALRRVFEEGSSLNGTISAEHGIGCAKKNYLSIAMEEEEIELMKKVKKAFDPKNILNPGKIFPNE